MIEAPVAVLKIPWNVNTDELIYPPDNSELWGSPDFNPLLEREMVLSQEAIQLTKELDLHPYMTPCIQVNINGGLADPEWRNCLWHNILAGEFNKTNAALLGHSPADILRAQGEGILHDAPQRLNKERMRNNGTCSNGEFVTCKVSPQELFAAEWNEDPVDGVPGLEFFSKEVLIPTRVTHLKWDGFYDGTWTTEDMMARLMDSSVAAVRNADGAYGLDTIMDPFTRIDMLKRYKPKLHEEGLKPEYYGRRTFDVLEEITRESIPYLTSMAMQANPEFMETYYKGNYVELIKNIVDGNVPFPTSTVDYPIKW